MHLDGWKNNVCKIKYYDIKNLLLSNNINPISSLSDNDSFTSLSSLNNANEGELTFFNDPSQLKKLKKVSLITFLYQKW